MPAIAESTRREMLEAEIDAAGPAAKAIYVQSLNTGAGLEFAAMCALRQAPGSKNTDRAFQDGARKRMNEMDPVNRHHIYAKAQAAGINTNGKYYKGGLGRYTDPQAWVATADDVIATCKRKQLDCEGVVNVKAAGTDRPPKKTRLAPHLVDRIVKDRVAADPLLAKRIRDPQVLKRVQGEVIEKHGRRGR